MSVALLPTAIWPGVVVVPLVCCFAFFLACFKTMSAATNRSKCWPVERKDVLACLNGSIPRGIKLVVFFHPMANIKFSMAPCFNLMEPYLNILQGLCKIAKNGLMFPTVLTEALEDLIKLRPQLVDPGLPLSIHIPSWGHQLRVLLTWCRKLVEDLAWKRMLRWVGSGHKAQIHQLRMIVANLVMCPAEGEVWGQGRGAQRGCNAGHQCQ